MTVLHGGLYMAQAKSMSLGKRNLKIKFHEVDKLKDLINLIIDLIHPSKIHNFSVDAYKFNLSLPF